MVTRSRKYGFSMSDATRRTTPLSSFDLRQEIKKLNRLDPKRANFDNILRTYNTIFVGLGIVIGKTRSTETLFRARIINEGPKPSSMSELAAPPANLVVGYQRCNRPGRSVFYASSRRMTALLECRVKQGDTVYLSQWMCKQPFPVNRYLEHTELWAKNSTPQAEALISHFDTLFTRRVDTAFSDDYKFTAAISEFLTEGLPTGADFDIRDDRSVALRYPSVVNHDESYNTAMSASMANERLDLLHVMQCYINHAEDDHVEVDVLDNGYGRKNGTIYWTGLPNKIPTLRDPKGVLFVGNGSGEWELQVRQDSISPSDIDALLKE